MSPSLSQPRDRISIVVPAKNEVATIVQIIEKCKPFSDDIIVVDGNSNDGTREAAVKTGVRVVSDNRRGKGDAMRCAIPLIKNEVTVFIDADHSHDPDDISSLTGPILANQSQMVIGSRILGGSDEMRGSVSERLRAFGTHFITFCINRKYNLALTDTLNGFRAIRTDILRQLNLTEDEATIEHEMICKLLDAGYNLDEVPTHEYRRQFGESKVHLVRHGAMFLYTVVKFLIKGKKNRQLDAPRLW